MELRGKKIALLVDSLYEDMEALYPYYRYREEGAEVVVVADKAGESYTSKHGYPIVSDKSFDEVKAADFDGVVIPGGYSPDRVRRHSHAVKFVKEMDAQGKLVAAICHAGWVLCSAGILKGRKVTCFFSIKDDVVNAGGLYENSEVVVDRNLVTSRQPDDLPAFCRAGIEVLAASPVLAK